MKSLKSMNSIYIENNKTKVIAMYLPQYHEIPENSLFWGDGYTDWVAVKNSKPLYEGHQQPRVPLDNRYYDLSRKEDIKWQALLAAEYGIYGFGIYHYWFNSNKHLLEKPAEIILENKDINFPFMFCWDNASWRRTWSNVKIGNDWAPLYEENNSQAIKNGVLAELHYGTQEDWKIHFEYLLDFFKDERYIKLDNCPLFSILNQDNGTDILKDMCNYWNELAKKSGFNGIAFIGKTKNNKISFTEHSFLYEPEWSGWTWRNQKQRLINKAIKITKKISNKDCFYEYDVIWKHILNNAEKNTKTSVFYSGFVAYDDSPRRGEKGKIVSGNTSKKFTKYMSQLLRISNEQNKEFLFLIAWNEWGEGAYLEPDTVNKYLYLEALKKAIEENNTEVRG